MEKEIEDLGGDPSAVGGGRPRQELLNELESAKIQRAETAEGDFEHVTP